MTPLTCGKHSNIFFIRTKRLLVEDDPTKNNLGSFGRVSDV